MIEDPLTLTSPARTRRAKASARSVSAPTTYPSRPYGVPLASASASSSVS